MKTEGYTPYDSIEAVEHCRETYSGFWKQFPRKAAVRFASLIKNSSDPSALVLCIGSGLGEEAELLTNLGLRPVWLDGAMEMAKTSHTKGFYSIRGTFLHLPFGQIFDGI